MTFFESNTPFERFVELSWRAQHFALVLCSFALTLVAYAIFRFHYTLRTRGLSPLITWPFSTLLSFTSYVGYTIGYVTTWSALEWLLTHQVQFCHLPGTTARVAPLACFLIARVLIGLRSEGGTLSGQPATPLNSLPKCQ